MAAVIAVGALTLAADGVTLTGTLSGGTGTGYAISSAAGIVPRRTGTVDAIVPTATPVISGGTTITITLPTPFLTGNTVVLDITNANTIVDSGANTGAVATGTAVTNNSTQTAISETALFTNLSSFNINGVLAASAAGLTIFGGGMAPGALASVNTGYSIEFVLNVTSGTVSVDIEGYFNPAQQLIWAVDAGAAQTQNGGASNLYNEYIRVASALGVGKHVIRCNAPSNYDVRNVRLIGAGAATFVTVPCPTAIFKDNVAGLNLASQVSPVKRWGTQKYTSNYINNNHEAFSFRVAGNFQGLQCCGYTGPGNGFIHAIATDQAPAPALDQYTMNSYAGPGGVLDNTFQMTPLVTGLSPGAHTVECLDISQLGYQAVRAYNGSALTSSAAAGAGTISVADITNIADGDWLCLDYLNNEELVKVASHSGAGPYTLTLSAVLAKAHASGVSVRNFTPANTPTLTTAAGPSFVGRLMFMGDSLTHAEALSQLNVFPAAGYANYDCRASYAMMAGRAANWDIIDAATQGWVASQVATDNAPTNDDPTPPCSAYVILIGANDFGAGVTPIATFTTAITNIINNIKTAAPSGTRIIFIKIFSPTPPGSTNGIGKTKTDYNNAIQAAITSAAAAGYSFQLIDLASLAGLNVASPNVDLPDGTHPSITSGLLTGAGGQNKLAAALYPILLGLAPKGFFAVL